MSRDARWVILTAALVMATSVGAEESESVVVTVAPGETLRSIAERYLDDPNLWTDILRASELRSPADATPGRQLRIPLTEVSLATTRLAASLEAIQQATVAGARVFATSEIEAAVEARREALEARRGGRLRECAERAEQSRLAGKQALARTLDARNAAAEALLRSRSGTVQGRRPDELDWSGRQTQARLIEREKLRTLSESSAVVLFVDESLLRLGANSQAVIQHMQVDQLTRRQEAAVSLEKGDVYALLGASGGRGAFDVKVPGVTTDSVSTDFWISREQDRARIANYDERGMRVSAGGDTVLLDRNQGTLVELGAAPTTPRDLLPAPVPSSPADDTTVTRELAVIGWSAVRGAAGYRIEVATDPAFHALVLERDAHPEHFLQVGAVGDGYFYWRVRSVDALGFPGPASRTRRLHVSTPDEPAYLAVTHPVGPAFQSHAELTLSGIGQPGARLQLDGVELAMGADGRFSQKVELAPGGNVFELVLTTRDGRTAQREVVVEYVVESAVPLRIEGAADGAGPSTLQTHGDKETVSGVSAPGVRVALETPGGAAVASALAGDDGRFSIVAEAGRVATDFVLRLETRHGLLRTSDLRLVPAVRAPRIDVDGPLPSVTSEPAVIFQGSVSGADRLTVNGVETGVTGGRFSAEVGLEPGPQQIEATAHAATGRVGRWVHRLLVDRQAPTLAPGGVRVSGAGRAEPTAVEIAVDDDGPLRRSAVLFVETGGGEHRVPLLLDRDRSVYRGVLPAAIGPWQLLRLVAHDAAGNRATLILDSSS